MNKNMLGKSTLEKSGVDLLSNEEELRYNRQIILKNMDFDGQEALKKSNVLILGLGGLGCTASQYLAASGVGSLTLVDDDRVELSNLHRQILHNDARIGTLKVTSAKTALHALNSHVKIKTISRRLEDPALALLIKEHTLVLDCSDNLNTRNQLNRLCYQEKTPLVSGAAIRLEGQLCVFTYQDDEPCYQCLSQRFKDQNLTCVESGILPPLVGIIGAIQALEAIKILTSFSAPSTGKLMLFDGMESQWNTFLLPKNKECEICQKKDINKKQQ